jgi:hypothetical protein
MMVPAPPLSQLTEASRRQWLPLPAPTKLELHCGVHIRQADIEEMDAQPVAAPAPPLAQLAGVDAAALEATILHTVCCIHLNQALFFQLSYSRIASITRHVASGATYAHLFDTTSVLPPLAADVRKW